MLSLAADGGVQLLLPTQPLQLLAVAEAPVLLSLTLLWLAPLALMILHCAMAMMALLLLTMVVMRVMTT